MSNLLASVTEALEALAAAGGTRAPASLTPGELVAVNAAFGALRRRVDAAFAPVAAEISRQSRAELGRNSLARTQGFRNPVSMISTTAGSTTGEALRMVQVGEATAPRRSLTGEQLPAPHPHVAAAVAAGVLGMAAASAIITLLDRLAVRVDGERLGAAEAELVTLAPGLRTDELAKVLARAEAHLDPDGVLDRHEEARATRGASVVERDGMIRLTGQWDVLTGAPIKAFLDGAVTHTLRANEHAADADRDHRSVKQIQADALSDLARHGLGCDAVPTGPTVTVVVRVALDDLVAGVGTATVDGIDQPVPAAFVRRIAADTQVIPCVLGGQSEIVDWGRAKRLFTPAQRLALAERDGGCAFCGAPPAWTIAHHIHWWGRDSGPTDLANGILLCTACHHRVHDDGWEIRIDGPGTAAQVWFLPPPWLDPARTPRPGGRRRYALTA